MRPLAYNCTMNLLMGLAALLLFCSSCSPVGLMDQVFVYFPEKRVIGTPDDAGLNFEDAVFAAEDGTTLHGWFLPGEDGRPLVLFFHGNAGNISHRLENLRLFRERLGVSVFILSYRGYGRSEGRPSEAGLYRDARGALAWLEERGWNRQEMIYFGRSLGAAVAAQLALEAPPAGLVLETPFPSIDAMGRRHYPLLYRLLGWTVEGRYDTLGKIGEIRTPLLIFQGDADEVVPVAMAREIFQAANAPKTFHLIPGAGHNDTVFVGGEAYWQKWRRFVGEVTPPAETRSPRD